MTYKVKKQKADNYNAISKQNIYIASKNVKPELRERYLVFMTIRFGKQYTTIAYAEEWAERFNDGHPEKFMDEESLKAYKYSK